ncbi:MULTISPECIES: phosphoribosylglycinamide formyltransferase [unclassified Herbaspirillum]|uniref:phosphoribosylglycinamide formyltransferase n=1 Tax=unclassified Herbaspirillum TaxID=2624150 RepID=UPI001151A35F|nr:MULTISPECIES: phosphoribosylglycinamide formyltransferase [unclassified Herbaspirillum]MBB5390761.1 phosphoribosylglycinamide formyltransferase-1 [Herbaspirillum sp. SJZ102]TQK08755.1 formyltetrahydrofolate-dependent phosphoribosylglycinamide formyltransferase [Herbaspirillum sp. SJZ130]TQK14558.1 formyltetrahydrofolate-dependent phosphoribosylglycinamide formyltransferase [Herbaspirillum sp. SJZ106]
MRSIVILISGRGSNMEAIVRAAQAEKWPARISAVISNRADASGLEFAAAHGIPTEVIPSRDYATRDQFDAALRASIDAYAPDLVVLAGFMRILTAPFVDHYRGRMLNIHPSLLPSFPGLATHRQALAAGVKLHGATVHFVTPDLDHGPIVAQACVPVLEGDSEEALAERVLEQEHVIYPRAVNWFVQGRLVLEGARVRLAPADAASVIAI